MEPHQQGVSFGGDLREPSLLSSTSRAGSGTEDAIDDRLGTWQRLALVLLTVVGLACLHGLLYHLHAILMPFILAGFIVLALQPTVEGLYGLLAGLAPPYRWCCCGLRRKRHRHRKRKGLASPGRARSRSSWSARGAEMADRMPDEEVCETEVLLDVPENCGTMLADGFCRLLALTIVISAMLIAVLLLLLIICHGAMRMKENWSAYQAGLGRLQTMQDRVIDTFVKEIHMDRKAEDEIKERYFEVFKNAEDGVWILVNSIVTGLSGGISFFAFVLLYVLFWLWAPLPTGGKAGALVRSYIYKKTIVSAAYGVCVAILFIGLGIDLAVLFGVISFFLNYVPEVGAFISMLIPVPIILLDGRIERPFGVLAVATFGQLFLKFIFSNVLEVKLIERDKEMNIHPVWVLLGLSYFGYLWGPIGMLISVPLMAMIKTAAMSARRTGDTGALAGLPLLVDLFLACFEGRRWRKHRDRRLSRSPSTGTHSPLAAAMLQPSVGQPTVGAESS